MRTIHRLTKKDLLEGLKILGWAIAVFCTWLLLLWATSADAQTVVRKGHSFYQQSSNKIAKDSVTFTGYHYFDSQGIRYPIYISSKGKCFIIRTSSKTGKKYKQYLPEVTKELTKK